MSQDKPEVIQGRLGWEDGDISEADPNELRPHPRNTDIYGDTDDPERLEDTFVESIREKGVLEPLVVTDDKKVISGHRRRLAAVETETNTVPVRFAEFSTDLGEREALIEFNRQRQKTPGQIINEFEEILAIEQQRAKDAMAEGGRKSTPGQRVANFRNPSETEPARDVAATKLDADISGETLEKGTKVKQTANDDETPEPVKQAAEKAWDDLQTGTESISGDYQTVKTAKNKHEKEARIESRKDDFEKALSQSDVLEIESGDFRDLLASGGFEFDHIVTDPPYDAESVDLFGDMARLAAENLSPGGLLIAYTGKSNLSDVMRQMDEHLEYFWQVVLPHEHDAGIYWPRNIRTCYRPILVYGKPPLEPLESRMRDVLDPGGMEKDLHEWQQAVGESEALIESMTEPNDTILDPMCGSGTVGMAALNTDRQAILIDRDEDAVATATERCYDAIR